MIVQLGKRSTCGGLLGVNVEPGVGSGICLTAVIVVGVATDVGVAVG